MSFTSNDDSAGKRIVEEGSSELQRIEFRTICAENGYPYPYGVGARREGDGRWRRPHGWNRPPCFFFLEVKWSGKFGQFI